MERFSRRTLGGVVAGVVATLAFGRNAQAGTAVDVRIEPGAYWVVGDERAEDLIDQRFTSLDYDGQEGDSIEMIEERASYTYEWTWEWGGVDRFGVFNAESGELLASGPISDIADTLSYDDLPFTLTSILSEPGIVIGALPDSIP